MHHVEDAVREARLLQEISHQHRSRRHFLRRFQYECVAACQRHREHPQRHHHRKIERRNARAHAQRLAHRVAIDAGADLFAVLAFDQMRYTHRELDYFNAALHRAGGIRQRLAMLGRDQARELILVGVEQLAKAHQDARAAQCRRIAPSRKRALRCLHRRIDIGRVAERHALGDLPGRRVGDVARARARCWFVFAVYPQRHRL